MITEINGMIYRFRTLTGDNPKSLYMGRKTLTRLKNQMNIMTHIDTDMKTGRIRFDGVPIFVIDVPSGEHMEVGGLS